MVNLVDLSSAGVPTGGLWEKVSVNLVSEKFCYFVIRGRFIFDVG